MKRVILTEAAKADLRSIRRRYNKAQPGLGHRFVRSVGKELILLGQNPEAMQVLELQIRRWPVSGFPHGLMYRVYTDEAVVLSVFHPKQHPSVWKTRTV